MNILLDLHRGTDNGIVKNNPKGEGRLRIISQRVGRKSAPERPCSAGGVSGREIVER